jgi:hypothetical protein
LAGKFHFSLPFLRKNQTMAYDAALAAQIDDLINTREHFTRKKMFGGLGYLLNGNMCIGVHKNDLLVRFDPEQTVQLLKRKHVRPFAIGGRSMKGWLLVEGPAAQEELNAWLEIALGYVETLPAKK